MYTVFFQCIVNLLLIHQLGAEVTHARFEGKGNPRVVGDTRPNAPMLSLWGQSLTYCNSSKNGNFELIFEI